MTNKNSKKQNLTDMLNNLDAIVEQMESEQLDLEKSLALFEKGISIIKDCQKSLTQAEQKVKLLTNDKLKDFEPEE
ncbi:MAG: exodeoxyribonuclease VII small subunit [Gammaproteobacteria bacterium RIFCSPHIGHO2_02_FULL_42_13]|nr:MAG: exodeoxyribonuclease VII small subunit [Gammaproteobacteria bacterium RIFCSPHIGHO2_02_FULL_42_13]OGT69659.1 MAG: exodeoxyribonuclease VII small subunit [Gammaproteobacteria bacterium RIFCSPLOWO2_02_FULL_42_9]